MSDKPEDETEGFIHVTPSEFTPSPENGCKHENTDVSFGMAGGGYGSYTFCLDCGNVLDKVIEHDE